MKCWGWIKNAPLHVWSSFAARATAKPLRMQLLWRAKELDLFFPSSQNQFWGLEKWILRKYLRPCIDHKSRWRSPIETPCASHARVKIVTKGALMDVANEGDDIWRIRWAGLGQGDMGVVVWFESPVTGWHVVMKYPIVSDRIHQIWFCFDFETFHNFFQPVHQPLINLIFQPLRMKM